MQKIDVTRDVILKTATMGVLRRAEFAAPERVEITSDVLDSAIEGAYLHCDGNTYKKGFGVWTLWNSAQTFHETAPEIEVWDDAAVLERIWAWSNGGPTVLCKYIAGGVVSQETIDRFYKTGDELGVWHVDTKLEWTGWRRIGVNAWILDYAIAEVEIYGKRRTVSRLTGEDFMPAQMRYVNGG